MWIKMAFLMSQCLLLSSSSFSSLIYFVKMLRRKLEELNLCLIQHLLHIKHKQTHTNFFLHFKISPHTLTGGMNGQQQSQRFGDSKTKTCSWKCGWNWMFIARASFDFNDSSIYVNQFWIASGNSGLFQEPRNQITSKSNTRINSNCGSHIAKVAKYK